MVNFNGHPLPCGLCGLQHKPVATSRTVSADWSSVARLASGSRLFASRMRHISWRWEIGIFVLTKSLFFPGLLNNDHFANFANHGILWDRLRCFASQNVNGPSVHCRNWNLSQDLGHLIRRYYRFTCSTYSLKKWFLAAPVSLCGTDRMPCAFCPGCPKLLHIKVLFCSCIHKWSYRRSPIWLAWQGIREDSGSSNCCGPGCLWTLNITWKCAHPPARDRLFWGAEARTPGSQKPLRSPFRFWNKSPSTVLPRITGKIALNLLAVVSLLIRPDCHCSNRWGPSAPKMSSDSESWRQLGAIDYSLDCDFHTLLSRCVVINCADLDRATNSATPF